MNPSFFGLDALGCVRHFHQPLLGDQLAGGFADAVCLVLDAYECHFEVADEFHLMGRQAAALLFGERSGSLLQHLDVGEVSSVSFDAVWVIVARRSS